MCHGMIFWFGQGNTLHMERRQRKYSCHKHETFLQFIFCFYICSTRKQKEEERISIGKITNVAFFTVFKAGAVTQNN